jgi:serine/threonine protein kinase
MPETINGFQVLRKIAESNTAEIFHVIRLVGRGRGNEFAVKVLRDAFAQDPTERDYLENEYRLCSMMDHPNLVHAHEIILTTERPFVVLDLINGPSMRQYLDKGRPLLSAALEWLAQAAEGLEYLHDQGYVHRDVKPQNIVVGDNGNVKVIDFALAAEADTSLGKHFWRRLRERRRPGTWSYMAPEQILNKRLTGQADVYSLGVSTFEVTAGRLPYVSMTSQGLLEQHLYGLLPSVRVTRPEAPVELDNFIKAMMAKEPLDRPMNMLYVSAKLRHLAELCAAIKD